MLRPPVVVAPSVACRRWGATWRRAVVAINSAALADEPAAAAKQLRKGLASAAGGTLFLDEVGDMPREVQSALRRVLASPHEARIVSAPSLNARDEWVLRPDLFYRLAEVEIEIPPLRDRESDIVTIAQGIYADYTSSRGYESAEPAFTDAAGRPEPTAAPPTKSPTPTASGVTWR